MIFDHDSIMILINKHFNTIDSKILSRLMLESGGIDPLEGVILYCLILEYNILSAIEFSPNAGYSTKWISLAFKKLNRKNSFFTFEINKKIIPKLKENLAVENLLDYVTVIDGHAIENIPKTIKDNNLNVGLCFIDSNHGYNFSQDYIKNIFPLLSCNCLICIHDICHDENMFKTSLLNNSKEYSGECDSIKEYINNKKYKYFILHSLTGGKHEGANKEINKNFYNELENITKINFISNNICPKTMFINTQ